ncbi:MAG: hypothetical protein LBB38_00390 [Puniceicoccales bacterium]|jgi:hypothetical protein|nr:hypothetical protein [Puniceicoccales bacterium]
MTHGQDGMLNTLGNFFNRGPGVVSCTIFIVILALAIASIPFFFDCWVIGSLALVAASLGSCYVIRTAANPDETTEHRDDAAYAVLQNNAQPPGADQDRESISLAHHQANDFSYLLRRATETDQQPQQVTAITSEDDLTRWVEEQTRTITAMAAEFAPGEAQNTLISSGFARALDYYITTLEETARRAGWTGLNNPLGQLRTAVTAAAQPRPAAT